MNGKDLLIDLGNISHKYYEEAETVAELNSEHKTLSESGMDRCCDCLTCSYHHSLRLCNSADQNKSGAS